MAVHLTQSEVGFIQAAGFGKIKDAAYHLVRTKLVNGDAVPDKGHPVFKAMKAIGAGDRKKLERNFGMEKAKKLGEPQVDTIVENIMGWLRGETEGSGKVQAKIAEF